jgi:hypothetical protein
VIVISATITVYTYSEKVVRGRNSKERKEERKKEKRKKETHT